MHTSEGPAAPGWFRRRLLSFAYAGRGIAHLVREPNARIHLVATALVIVLAAALRVSLLEWAVLVLAIGLVLAAESLNTALEHLANAAVPSQHVLVGSAKDLGAGAVLVAALAAACIGALVLGPHLWCAF